MKRNLVTAEELAAIERVNNDCMKLHICPPPVTFVDMEVKNAAGEVIDSFLMKSNSWVRNAYNTEACFMAIGGPTSTDGGSNTFREGSLKFKDTAGVERTTSLVPLGIDNYLGASGNSTGGIQVGTGNSAESLDFYKLESLIANGNASGQMNYAAGTASLSYNATSKKWTNVLSRIMNNNSGAPIDVKEVGLVNYSSYPFLMSRDLLATTVTVPNGGQLTVTYTIEMTFPA
jgi:hypothetical protein